MRNLKDFKTFEAEQIGTTPLITSEEDLTNYYKCNKCGNLFYIFNDIPETCNSCRSNDIIQISDFDYFTDLKTDKNTYNKEYRLKLKREKELVDLVNVGINKEQQRYYRSFN